MNSGPARGEMVAWTVSGAVGGPSPPLRESAVVADVKTDASPVVNGRPRRVPVFDPSADRPSPMALLELLVSLFVCGLQPEPTVLENERKPFS